MTKRDKPKQVFITRDYSRKPPPASAVWLSAPQVCDRFGRSHMWLERRLKEDEDFPRPTKFGRLRFFRLEAIEDYERRRTAEPPQERLAAAVKLSKRAEA